MGQAHRLEPGPGVINPWAIVGALLAWGASIAGAGWIAYGAGQKHEIATQAREDRAAEKTRDTAERAIAAALAKQETRNVQITQRLEQQVREVPVFRDCIAPDGVVRDLNAAITGADPVAPGDRPVPAADAASGAR